MSSETEFQFKFPPKEELCACVCDLSTPLAQRMRAIFYLRTLGGDDAVNALCKGEEHIRILNSHFILFWCFVIVLTLWQMHQLAAIVQKEGTSLFRHEIGYVLGQMKANAAVPTLIEILRDETDDVIVRHECGEALGAIAAPETLEILEQYSNDKSSEVAETVSASATRVVMFRLLHCSPAVDGV
jgi:deoxyhypusine monooxygenase